MKLFVCPNQNTPGQIAAARRSIETLERRLGAQCALSGADSRAVFGSASRASLPPEACDLIVSIGGDGAVLRAAQTALAADRPLLGINGGRLGYLCALDLADVGSLTGEALARWPISPRTLLAFRHGGRERLALNDVVIAKRSFGATVELLIRFDGQADMSLRGDGVILATPTGSTAYNLSAGGPILMPDAPCFALTPICAHASQRGARVFSDRSPVTVSIPTGRPDAADACIYADGALLGPLDGPLTVRRAEKTLALLAPRPLDSLL